MRDLDYLRRNFPLTGPHTEDALCVVTHAFGHLADYLASATEQTPTMPRADADSPYLLTGTLTSALGQLGRACAQVAARYTELATATDLRHTGGRHHDPDTARAEAAQIAHHAARDLHTAATRLDDIATVLHRAHTRIGSLYQDTDDPHTNR